MRDKISLSQNRHDRDSAGLTYVYPVLSRRAKGVSIGINLNTNNACNWRCIYCQVPDLSRGAAPVVNLELLRRELSDYLSYAEKNSFTFFDDDGQSWPVVDICFSGNGEPTASPQFSEAVDIVLELLKNFNLQGKLKLVVISNGSEVYKPAVQASLKKLNEMVGEIWFKIDAGVEADWRRINQTHLTPERVINHLALAANSITTRIQTCVFGVDTNQIDKQWLSGYLELLTVVKHKGVPVRDVLLYSVARPPQLVEGQRLQRVSEAELLALKNKIESVGLECLAFSS